MFFKFFIYFNICLVCHGKISKFTEKEIRDLRADVKAMFYHAYDGYIKYAMPYDELRPLTCDGHDTWGSYSLTLIDALDTLAVMNNKTEFQRVYHLISERENFDADINVSVFETNIRIVGGLLGGHLMARRMGVQVGPEWPCDGPLLKLAVDAATRLLPAFNTPTGMPYGTVNLRHGVPEGETPVTCTAGVGTYVIEFGTISRLTGDPIFEQVAVNAMQYLWGTKSRLGLIGNHIDVLTGRWTDVDAGIGAGVDSFYEYAVKGAYLLQRPELMDIFLEGRAAIDEHLRHEDWYLWKSMTKGHVTMAVFQSLEAFWPGLLTLVGDIESAQRTMYNYHQILKQYGFHPEFYNIPEGGAYTKRSGYPLRPEFVESLMYLYQATGDHQLLKMGADLLKSIEHSAKTECGYATIRDVNDHSLDNRMESFFLAETTKYLYLLFHPEHWLHPFKGKARPHRVGERSCLIEGGGYFFNTEAHPIDSSTFACCTGPKDEDLALSQDDLVSLILDPTVVPDLEWDVVPPVSYSKPLSNIVHVEEEEEDPFSESLNPNTQESVTENESDDGIEGEIYEDMLSNSGHEIKQVPTLQTYDGSSPELIKNVNPTPDIPVVSPIKPNQMNSTTTDSHQSGTVGNIQITKTLETETIENQKTNYIEQNISSQTSENIGQIEKKKSPENAVKTPQAGLNVQKESHSRSKDVIGSTREDIENQSMQSKGTAAREKRESIDTLKDLSSEVSIEKDSSDTEKDSLTSGEQELGTKRESLDTTDGLSSEEKKLFPERESVDSKKNSLKEADVTGKESVITEKDSHALEDESLVTERELLDGSENEREVTEEELDITEDSPALKKESHVTERESLGTEKESIGTGKDNLALEGDSLSTEEESLNAENEKILLEKTVLGDEEESLSTDSGASTNVPNQDYLEPIKIKEPNNTLEQKESEQSPKASTNIDKILNNMKNLLSNVKSNLESTKNLVPNRIIEPQKTMKGQNFDIEKFRFNVLKQTSKLKREKRFSHFNCSVSFSENFIYKGLMVHTKD